MAAPNAEKVPAFDGESAPFLDFGHQVHLRMRATVTDPASRAPLLVVRLNAASRQGCHSAGEVTRILVSLRNYFAPAAADSTRRQVMRILRFRRAGQSFDAFVV